MVYRSIITWVAGLASTLAPLAVLLCLPELIVMLRNIRADN